MSSPRSRRSGPHRIGAAAALTGLPANTIRTWERRYGVVEPGRSEAGGRRYSDEEIERLITLRRLTEQGHGIGELARLDNDALRVLLAKADDTGPFRVGVADVQLAARMRKLDDRWRIDPILDITGMETFKGHALVVGLHDLGEHPVDQVVTIKERRQVAVFVVYDFAPRHVLERLAAAGAWTLRGPLRELKTLRRLLRLTSDRKPSARTPARRFEARDLHRLVELNTSVGCECPQHLAGIIQSLVAFEDYSRRCESKNPEDAELHALLAEGTGVARQKMESLLVAVIDAEGLADKIR
jgi:DNA-binding transcriptional MerR regulator